MQHVEDSIKINAPVEEVFAFVSDPDNAPDWIPGMVEVTNVKKTGDVVTYDWVYKMVGIRFNGRSERLKVRLNKSFETKSEGAIKSTWKYELEDHRGQTKFHLAVDYEVPTKVGQKIAEKMLLKHNERQLAEGLQLVKNIIEFQLGRAAAE